MEELFKLSPFGNVEEFVFESFDYKPILEDAKNDKNDPLIQKILNGIAKIINWIKTALVKAINWLKSLFINNSKSADQIAEELKLKFTPENMAKKLSVHLTNDDRIRFIVRPNQEYIGIIFSYLKNPKFIDELASVLDNISNGEFDAGNATAVRARQEIFHKLSQSNGTQIILTMEELIAFQKRVNELADKSANIILKEMPIDTQHRGQMIACINNANYTVLKLQMAINEMMLSFKELYSLDESYEGAITEKETAASFASKSIEAGIPSKYIAKNLSTVLSKELRGENFNKNKPPMGQSRIVFFPSKDKNTVFKVAINKIGVVANKTEIDITNRFKDFGIDDTIAKIMKSYLNGVAVDAEKAIMDNNVDREKLGMMINKIKEAYERNGSNFEVGDLHQQNIGRIGDRNVIVDYGALTKVN